MLKSLLIYASLTYENHLFYYKPLYKRCAYLEVALEILNLDGVVFPEGFWRRVHCPPNRLEHKQNACHDHKLQAHFETAHRAYFCTARLSLFDTKLRCGFHLRHRRNPMNFEANYSKSWQY